jgi:hypothetical protein
MADGKDGKWDDKKDVIHGTLDSGRKVTVKFTKDGDEALVARGHVEDIQRDVDHAHVWHQKSGDPDHHDKRRGNKIFTGTPDQRDGWNEVRVAKDNLIARAQSLSSSTNWREGGNEFRSLMDQWKALASGKRDTDNAQWAQFNAAKSKFFDARKAEFERRDRDSAEALRVKERIISNAESLAYVSDLRAASDTMRKLSDEWKSAPRAKREDEDKLWTRFNAAKTKLNSRRDEERRKREGDEAKVKAVKQAIVSSARSLAQSSDLRAARDEMRRLSDRWKAAGRAPRTDEDSLYKEFKAAQDALYQRAKAEGAKREEEQKAALRTKEQIIAQIKSLTGASDLRAATDQVKALSDQYFAAGSAGREHNERLKSAFQSAKTTFFDAKKRESERKKAEWEANKRTRISEMEQRVREMESRISQARYQLSDAWSQLSQTRSRPQPSWTNPHRSDIMARQYQREQRTQQRINQIESRISSMEAKVVSMKMKLSQLYSR